MMLKHTLPLVIVIFIAGCAAPQTRTPIVSSESAVKEAEKQREFVLKDKVATARRLNDVGSKVLIAGTEFCGEKVGPYFGIKVWNIEDIDKDWRATATSLYGLSQLNQVSMVIKDSAADKAGIKEGDVILALNAWQPPVGKDSPVKIYDKLDELGKTGMPVDIKLRRGSEEHDISVTPTQACDFRIRYSNEPVKNAYADGKNITVTKQMMDFLKDDNELALVLSHELAHNSMKHIDAQKTNAIAGGAVGLLLDIAAAFAGVNTNGDFSRLGSEIGIGAYSVEFESEADYVGLYIMAASGYPIDDAPNLWRRMSVDSANVSLMQTSHPSNPERFLALEATIKEIKAKQADGRPLKPELKKPVMEAAE